jgi:DNA-binding FadR family transcriptional regulator
MRTNEGLAAARARGRKSKLILAQARLMYEAKDAKGKRLPTVAEIASAFNVSRGTVYRALERAEQARSPHSCRRCPTTPHSPTSARPPISRTWPTCSAQAPRRIKERTDRRHACCLFLPYSGWPPTEAG